MREKRHIVKKGNNFSRRKSRGIDKKKSLLHAISKNKQKERIHRFPPKDSLPDNSLLIKTAIDEAVTSHVCPAFKLLRLKVQHAKSLACLAMLTKPELAKPASFKDTSPSKVCSLVSML